MIGTPASMSCSRQMMRRAATERTSGADACGACRARPKTLQNENSRAKHSAQAVCTGALARGLAATTADVMKADPEFARCACCCFILGLPLSPSFNRLDLWLRLDFVYASG
jgi:hypothetical protein